MALALVTAAVERGESISASRLLLAVYHPSHLFLLLTDDREEEGRLRQVISRQAALSGRPNLRVLAGGQEVSHGGSSRLAATLRLAHAALTAPAAARGIERGDGGEGSSSGSSSSSSSGSGGGSGSGSSSSSSMQWDWFIHLKADDYPLTTPDGEIEGW